MNDIPIVELQVRGLAQHMTSVVAQYHKDIEAIIADGVKREIANFDYGEIVKMEVQGAIKKHVASSVNAYFSFGKGRELIDYMVNDILNDVVKKVAE